MMKRLTNSLIFCLILLLPVTVLAVNVPGLDRAKLAVANQSASTLSQALPKALAQVLIKQSGNPEIMTLPAMQAAASNVMNYVINYRYLDNTTSNAYIENSQNVTPYYLQVQFDDLSIRHLLSNAGQAIWGARRPLTLVWLTIPEDQETIVVSSDGDSDFQPELLARAQQRGLSIILPAMDLQDQSMIPPSLNMPTANQIQEVAARYRVKSVLAGVVTVNSNGQFTCQWQWWYGGTPEQWQDNAPNVQGIINGGVDRAMEMMASQFAVMDGKGLQTTVRLQVDGIRNLEDYVHVVQALKNLTPVSNATISNMGNGSVLLKVDTAGGAAALQQALIEATQFTQEEAPANSSEPMTADLYFYWGAPPPSFSNVTAQHPAVALSSSQIASTPKPKQPSVSSVTVSPINKASNTPTSAKGHTFAPVVTAIPGETTVKLMHSPVFPNKALPTPTLGMPLILPKKKAVGGSALPNPEGAMLGNNYWQADSTNKLIDQSSATIGKTQ